MQQLKDISQIQLRPGHSFRGKIPEATGTGVRVVQMKDISQTDGVTWNTCLETQPSGKQACKWLQCGDILLAARGSHNYAVHINALGDCKALAAPHFFVIRLPSSSPALPEFLAWWLNQAPCQRHFEQNSAGTLTKSIRLDALASAPITLPPLVKQQSIIKLANTLRQEQHILEQLLANGQRLMQAIASDIVNDKESPQ